MSPTFVDQLARARSSRGLRGGDSGGAKPRRSRDRISTLFFRTRAIRKLRREKRSAFVCRCRTSRALRCRARCRSDDRASSSSRAEAPRLDDGALRLSIVDLHTNIGFEVSNGKSSRSISATGAIAFRVGVYALVALPGADSVPAELAEPMCASALIAPKHPYRDYWQSCGPDVNALPPEITARASRFFPHRWSSASRCRATRNTK